MDYTNYLTITLVALGLAMDCFAVSVSRGMVSGERRLWNALLLASSFGLFQALMPVLGYYSGESLAGIISGVDHWAPFLILGIIGSRMIIESRKKEEKCEVYMTLPLLFTLSVATSIDAFAVGLSFAFLNAGIFKAAIIIGAASFLLSLAGFLVGCRAKSGVGGLAEAFGGIILVGIGARILIEHLL